MFASLPLAELTAAARTLYVGCRDTPEIAALLAADDYAYEEKDYDEGLDLVEDVEAKAGDQMREYGEQFLATAAANARLAELEALFVRHRTLARAKHRRGSAGYRALGLAGHVPQDNEELMAAADQFYRAIDADPSLAVGVRGLGAAAIVEGRSRVVAARTASLTREKETGEAQRATSLRDDVVARLRAHAAELATVAKVALAARPQLREVLGLRQRS